MHYPRGTTTFTDGLSLGQKQVQLGAGESSTSFSQDPPLQPLPFYQKPHHTNPKHTLYHLLHPGRWIKDNAVPSPPRLTRQPCFSGTLLIAFTSFHTFLFFAAFCHCSLSCPNWAGVWKRWLVLEGISKNLLLKENILESVWAVIEAVLFLILNQDVPPNYICCFSRPHMPHPFFTAVYGKFWEGQLGESYQISFNKCVGNFITKIFLTETCFSERCCDEKKWGQAQSSNFLT